MKAWAMREHGWTEAQAHHWLQSKWPYYDPWNQTFREVLRRRSIVAVTS